MSNIVLLRHGQSLWNKEKRFTGWANPGLTGTGKAEATNAGQWIKIQNIEFDLAFCSYLTRSHQTLSIALYKAGQNTIPVNYAWQLNERNLGQLEGLYFTEAENKFGKELTWSWRQNYNVRPPELNTTDIRYPGNNPDYSTIAPEKLPKAESYKDLSERILDYWNIAVLPEIKQGKHILLVTHQNVIKVLIQYLEHLSEQQTVELKIPTATPMLYNYKKTGNVFFKPKEFK